MTPLNPIPLCFRRGNLRYNFCQIQTKLSNRPYMFSRLCWRVPVNLPGFALPLTAALFSSWSRYSCYPIPCDVSLGTFIKFKYADFSFFGADYIKFVCFRKQLLLCLYRCRAYFEYLACFFLRASFWIYMQEHISVNLYYNHILLFYHSFWLFSIALAI